MKGGYKLVALEEKAKESRKVDIMIYENSMLRSVLLQ